MVIRAVVLANPETRASADSFLVVEHWCNVPGRVGRAHRRLDYLRIGGHGPPYTSRITNTFMETALEANVEFRGSDARHATSRSTHHLHRQFVGH